MFTNSENGLAIEPIVHDAMGSQQLAFTWIKYDSYDSVAMRFAKTVRLKGASQAIADFAGLLKADAIPESSVNSLGYRLLSRKKTADAARIFPLNVELYPDSANTYDSLGEGYMAAGDKAQAVKNYERDRHAQETERNVRNTTAEKSCSSTRCHGKGADLRQTLQIYCLESIQVYDAGRT
jgi:tetratricopeptide (TPR) repeat protein